jgi:hypothetical protein
MSHKCVLGITSVGYFDRLNNCLKADGIKVYSAKSPIVKHWMLAHPTTYDLQDNFHVQGQPLQTDRRGPKDKLY